MISVATMQTKQNKQRRIECEEDRISLLPDCLLIEIISRIPCTKQAIKTGTLSKRWKNLWTEVHNLLFRLPYGEESELYSYIDKLLKQRGHRNLNKFQLYIPYSCGIDKQVDNLIRYGVSCNVQDLDLEISTNYKFGFNTWVRYAEFVFDQFFYINSSFTHMKLDGCVFNPSGAVSWTNLKNLCIICSELDDAVIKNILSGSPLLETLKLKDCYDFGEINITSKSVKNLFFSGYMYDTSDPRDKDVITINAPHILSLTIEEEFPLYVRQVCLLNVSSLVEATLDYYESWSYPPKNEKAEKRMLKDLILSLGHVKKLKIGDNCVETLARLKAKGFTFPSNMEHPELPDNDSSESEDCSDNDSTESED